MTIPVLDKGFIRLVKYMASDADVVEAARVSHKSVAGEPDKDKKLIHYLLTNKHGSPFEHAVLKFHVKLPIFCARQWIRHRTSSYNETSFRYREVPDDFYIPSEWRGQDGKNKQGSSGVLADGEDISASLREDCERAMLSYRTMIAAGVSREMARIVIPTNIYTEWYWTANARAIMNFIELRSEAHAQWEMRQYSNALWRIFAKVMPWTAEAFLSTLNLSRYTATSGTPGPNAGDLANV